LRVDPSRVLGFGRGQLRDYKPARARTRKPPSRISKSSKKATGASLMADLVLRCRRLMIRCRRRCSRRLRRAWRERMLLASAMNLCASCKSEKLYLSGCLKMCSTNGRRFSESGSPRSGRSYQIWCREIFSESPRLRILIILRSARRR
jgi:hypothetical protein